MRINAELKTVIPSFTSVSFAKIRINPRFNNTTLILSNFI